MPISLSAKKSLRKSIKNRKENLSLKSKIKQAIKTFLTKPSEAGLKEVYAAVDKGAKKNIYRKNKASRLKAKFSKSVAPKTTAKKAAKMS
jgi:ribosomal protein S20